MQHLGFAFLAYLSTVLQVSVAPHLAIGGAEPQFLLLVMIVAAFTVSEWTAILWAAIAGLLLDCIGGGPFGVGMLCCTLTGAFLSQWRQKADRPHAAALVGIIFMALCSELFLAGTLSAVLSSQLVDHVRLMVVVFGSALWTTALVSTLVIGYAVIARVLTPRRAV